MYVAEKWESQTHWETVRVDKSPRDALIWSTLPDVRIGSRTYSKKWKMVKHTGDTVTSSSYDDASDVIKTTAIVEVDRQYTMRKSASMYRSSTGNEDIVTADSLRGTVAFRGLKSRKEITQSVKSGSRISVSHCSIDASIGC